LRRAIGTIPVILLISLLVFLLIHAAPGDPADLLLSDQATPQDVAEARHRWGLDQPLYVQYLRFLVNVLKGDFGTSFRYSDPVITVIGERLPATIELAVVSLLIAVALGLPLGVWAGAKPNSWADNLGSFFGFFGIARGSETGFYITASLLAGNFAAAWDGVRHIILPAIALGTNMMGIIMRVTRSAVLEVMHEDFVRTARAKGVPERAVLWRHVLRNALVPVITVGGLELGTLLS